MNKTQACFNKSNGPSEAIALLTVHACRPIDRTAVVRLYPFTGAGTGCDSFVNLVYVVLYRTVRYSALWHAHPAIGYLST